MKINYHITVEGSIGVGKTSLAKILAEETLIGSARLIESSNIDPKKLKENVTSSGGTTEAGLLVLQSKKNGLYPLLKSTINNAIKRAKELNFDG